ncbi:MAG: PHP domain-containing protein [Ruminococcaceae bacterium]|nr:PHP domain-containing protein [Oscillospiraceae bacterium]
MKISVDLHIHSDLSPCGDSMMTPGNIVGMAVVNGLDAIAITDHNCWLNVPVALNFAKEYGITVIPGMELETIEEIHVVCLFPDTEAIKAFQEIVDKSYSPGENISDIFGKQNIYDEDDEILGEHIPMLLAPTGISIDDVFEMVDNLGGIAYPAHVNRDSYSVLASFGMMPYGYPHKVVEISMDCDIDEFVGSYPEMRQYKFIRSSDAHYCEKISEEGTFIEVDENTPEKIIKSLKLGNIIY